MQILALSLLLCGADPEAILKSAEPLRSLDSFLDSYIGECNKGDAEQKQTCQANASAFRAAHKGKLLSVELPNRAFQKLTPVPSKDPGYLLYEFTPLFDGGGYGLTFQKPTKTERDGSVNVRRERLRIPQPTTPGEEPAALAAMRVDRLVATLVFTVDEVWKTKRPQGFTLGLVCRPKLLRLQDSRGGEVADTVF